VGIDIMQYQLPEVMLTEVLN